MIDETLVRGGTLRCRWTGKRVSRTGSGHGRRPSPPETYVRNSVFWRVRHVRNLYRSPGRSSRAPSYRRIPSSVSPARPPGTLSLFPGPDADHVVGGVRFAVVGAGVVARHRGRGRPVQRLSKRVRLPGRIRRLQRKDVDRFTGNAAPVDQRSVSIAARKSSSYVYDTYFTYHAPLLFCCYCWSMWYERENNNLY